MNFVIVICLFGIALVNISSATVHSSLTTTNRLKFKVWKAIDSLEIAHKKLTFDMPAIIEHSSEGKAYLLEVVFEGKLSKIKAIKNIDDRCLSMAEKTLRRYKVSHCENYIQNLANETKIKIESLNNTADSIIDKLDEIILNCASTDKQVDDCILPQLEESTKNVEILENVATDLNEDADKIISESQYYLCFQKFAELLFVDDTAFREAEKCVAKKP